MVKIKRVWRSLLPKSQQLEKVGDLAESGAEVSKAVLEFAIALGVLATAPSASVVAAGLSFVGIARKGLELLRDNISQEFNVEEWVAIAFPLAYIQSFDALVQRNDWLQEKIDAGISSSGVTQQFEKLGELELNESVANEVLTNFTESTLGQALNYQLSNYLQQALIEQHIASIITGWVAWKTFQYVELLLSYEPENIRQALSLRMSAAAEIRSNEKYASIEFYLIEWISPSPSNPLLSERWKVIDEEFTFPDIYVSLKAHLLDNGEFQQEVSLVSLDVWAKECLTSPEKNSQVMFIQAGPGRGKSVFCRMFANWVREHLHPIWTPILIRLRDIDTFEPNIENTLRAAVRQDFTTSNHWLSDRNTRYLFILDGFDELCFQDRPSKGIKTFLKQIGSYQRGCKHRFLVTGRESVLQGIENFVPTNLERVEIALMNDRLQEQWLEKWGRLVGRDKAEAFIKFLVADTCPSRVQELAREPLLLYLLAAMHRDNKLNIEMFRGSNGVEAKILIYQTTLDWVLTKQRPKDLNTTITEFDTEDLRLILMEAGLCVTQSGREWTSIKTIESRLKGDKAIEKMLSEAQQRLGENPLRNALAAFYLRPAKASEKAEGAVEFIHKSFGEFLCAQRLIKSFEKWIQVDPESRREDFLIKDKELSEEIYDLFSYGRLTREIVDYLIALTDANKGFKLQSLFRRLEEFYLDWCQGKFINESSKNLPLDQMQKLQKQGLSLGLREVDIFTGLNIMILLLEIHRYAQIKDRFNNILAFFPCGQENSEDFDAERLYRIINYSNSVIPNTFLTTVGYFLSGVNLRSVNLKGANLSCVNLSNADLSGADLSGADLSGADLLRTELSGANLLRTELYSADLFYANLSEAELSYSNFSECNLSHANLSKANLYCTDFYCADLSHADLSEANLSYTNFSMANLEGTKLEGTKLYDDGLGRYMIEE